MTKKQIPPTAVTSRKVRADAQRNRERILEIARLAFTRHGSAAALDDIARRAGVGPGTLYRHFPNREALILAVYQHDVQRLVDSVPQLLREHPPLTAVALWFERLASYIRLKHGLGDALDAATKQSITDDSYGPVVGAIASMLQAGAADGTIRPGLDPGDVLLLMSCLWRTPETADGRAQLTRLLDQICRSLQP